MPVGPMNGGTVRFEDVSCVTAQLHLATASIANGAGGVKRLVAFVTIWNSSVSYKVTLGDNVIISTPYLGGAVRAYNDLVAGDP